MALSVAFDAAWRRAVAAREALGQHERAEADRTAAASLWAAPPALKLNHRNDRFQGHAGRRETELALAWPLWLPGQRAARTAVAEANAALAAHAQAAARLRVAGEVREAAWALVAAHADLAQSNSSLDSLAALAADVDRRVLAGDLARADALAARAEVHAAHAQRSETQQRLVTAVGHWTGLTGLAAHSSPALDAAASSDPADWLTAHPAAALASATVQHMRKRVELVRVSRRDAPELTIGLRQDTPGRAEAAQNSLAIALRVPFGTVDRNRPLDAAAMAELDVAETAEQRLRERLVADAATARSAAAAAEQQLGSERDRAALLRERARLIDKSFRAGESPLPDLLRALAAATQAEAALARQQAALGLARARLQQALGLLP